MAICILPRGLFSSAPFFNVCSGDKHPAAHVFNPEQARLERAFVCWGGCFSAAFPCAPFQRWRRASCRTWASSFCSAVASSNLPRSTPCTKTKQSCFQGRCDMQSAHLLVFVRAQKNPHSQPPYQAQLGLIGTVVQSENECACCVVDKSCVLQY